LNLPSIIAIDGPAASGKSTLAKRLAEHLNYLYFDTGVMYRAITWVVLQRGANPADEAAATALAETVTIDVQPATVDDGRDFDVLVEGQDITWDIRRARRRYDERVARADRVSFETILDAMRKRDQIDSTRDVAPLRAADDAIVIDSDHMDIEAVLLKTKALLADC
jgi:cytidylate kinase